MASNSLSYVGLAFRAGKTLIGTAACEKGIKHGKVRLLLLQQSISAGSAKRFQRLCETHDVDVIKVKESLGSAIGRSEIMVIGIIDKGFAKTIKNSMDTVEGVAKYE